MSDEVLSKKKTAKKRSFLEAWLSDEKLKSWIRKVSDDNSRYHCIVCNKYFPCTSSAHVLRHSDSASHKRNASALLNTDDATRTAKKSRKSQFQPSWLEIEDFKPWLRRVSHDKTLVFCSLCDKSFDAGLSKIYRHAESERHQKLSGSLDENQDSSKLLLNVECPLPFQELKQATEIRFAAFVAEKNIPFSTAKDILRFFQNVDPDVLQSMSMGDTKISQLLSNVVEPIETERTVSILQNSKFSIFIDETSDICNEKWMTFHVRYVDPETLDIRSQLVKLINLNAQNCDSEYLFQTFKKELIRLQIPVLNIVALSTDNAAVMTGKHNSFKTKITKICPNLLTLPCVCHSAALVAHAACAKIPDQIKAFVRKIAIFINGSPKRLARL